MIYMKKLVAISVLFAILTVAVFAQDDEGKWKVGFKAQFVTDMLFMTSASGKSERTNAAGTWKQEFGKYNKGTIIWFDNAEQTDSGSPPRTLTGHTSRMLLSLSNSGENYEVYADIAFDDWHNKWGGVLDFLGNGSADWYLKGTAGIFEAQVGSNWFNTGGWVSAMATWNDWYEWNTLNRFGVWRRTAGYAPGDWWVGGFVASDDFRTWPEFGNTATVGMHLGDNFKFTLGYKLNPGYSPYDDQANNFADAWASKSSINGSFLLSGRPVDALTFDLFYSVIGKDEDTLRRPVTTTAGYTNPGSGNGFWHNTIGAYIGLNIVENLGISLGYTANFNAFDAGSYLAAADVADPTKSKPVTYNAPMYSGIDVRLSYSGIDKIGLIFNNNVSLANVKGEKVDDYKEKVTLLFNETTFNAEGQTQDWFHWESSLQVTLGFIENVGLTLQLGNRLGVSTDETSLSGSSSKDITTNNTFRATLGADYGVGAISLGVGLIFQLDSTKVENTNTTGSTTTSFTGETNVVKFGIPLVIKVAF
jgi:hypothetical protein